MTQQLARVNSAVLDECRVNVGLLNDVCSFRALDAADYLDLDWSPRLLEAAAVTARIAPGLLGALRLATVGEDEVSASYREASDTVWEHPVSYLTSERVDEVHAALAALDDDALLDHRNVVEALATLPSGSHPGNADQYIAEHWTALRDFYAGASDRGLCMILWSD